MSRGGTMSESQKNTHSRCAGPLKRFRIAWLRFSAGAVHSVTTRVPLPGGSSSCRSASIEGTAIVLWHGTTTTPGAVIGIDSARRVL